MKRVFLVLVVAIMVASLSVVCFAYGSFSIPANGNGWSSYSTATGDGNYYVYTDSVSFHGMPGNTHPVNFELYYRPYVGTNNPAASTYITFSYSGDSNGNGKIGHTGKYGYYSSGYGGAGQSYHLKSNTNNNNGACTVYLSWQA